MNKTIHTKFGTAQINVHGYYHIVSKKEGNEFKLLHKLIFEDVYGIAVPKGYIIHHKNGNKLDNCILNLQLLHNKIHSKLHNTGENNPMYNKNHSEDVMVQMSKSKSSTNIFRVHKAKDKSTKQGFTWVYQYFEDHRRVKIRSVSLNKLKEKVLKKGLTWKEL